jgi:hypothetical protein
VDACRRAGRGRHQHHRGRLRGCRRYREGGRPWPADGEKRPPWPDTCAGARHRALDADVTIRADLGRHGCDAVGRRAGRRAWSGPEDLVHGWGVAVGQNVPAGWVDFVEGLVTAACDAVLGFTLGMLIIPVVNFVIASIYRAVRPA